MRRRRLHALRLQEVHQPARGLAGPPRPVDVRPERPVDVTAKPLAPVVRVVKPPGGRAGRPDDLNVALLLEHATPLPEATLLRCHLHSLLPD
jgi:hypothetical protein